MAKRLIPTFNRILVEKIIPPSKTSAGILLPEKTSQVCRNFLLRFFIYVPALIDFDLIDSGFKTA